VRCFSTCRAFTFISGGTLSTAFTNDAKSNTTSGYGLTAPTRAVGLAARAVRRSRDRLYLSSAVAMAEIFTGSGGAVTWTPEPTVVASQSQRFNPRVRTRYDENTRSFSRSISSFDPINPRARAGRDRIQPARPRRRRQDYPLLVHHVSRHLASGDSIRVRPSRGARGVPQGARR
jgi:hypothetical protein